MTDEPRNLREALELHAELVTALAIDLQELVGRLSRLAILTRELAEKAPE